MRRWLGLKDLLVDVFVALDEIASGTGRRTVGTVAAVARLVPSLEPSVNVAEGLIRAGIGARSALLRGLARGISGAIDVAHRLAAGDGPAPASDDTSPTPIRSDAMGSMPWLRDAALGAVNGVAGDYLAERGNRLELEMTFRSDGARLELSRDSLARALPDATGRICVLVHGLATTDWSWSWAAEKRHGDPAATYGTRLKEEAGFTPVYLRYNSGRHVSENGRDLSNLLNALVGQWPTPVESIILIGHSMGGLVARSACHYGAEADSRWVRDLRHVYCIASPHRGAALEQVGNVLSVLLRAVPSPGMRLARQILDRRSAGIKDLRFGYLRDDEWVGRDPDALLDDNRRETPLLRHVEYTYVSGTVTESRDSWFGRIIGDLLVRVPSALGDASVPGFHVGSVTHVGLANDARVYAHIANRLGSD